MQLARKARRLCFDGAVGPDLLAAARSQANMIAISPSHSSERFFLDMSGCPRANTDAGLPSNLTDQRIRIARPGEPYPDSGNPFRSRFEFGTR
jgi:hypothetical protein